MTRITKKHIEASAFTSDLDSVDELTIQKQGATDLGDILQCRALTSLSLPFNSFSALKGIDRLPRLQLLNVMRNSITSLDSLASLTSLSVLKASYNKISSIAPLAGLSSLAELWLPHNAILKVDFLPQLSVLTALTALVLHPNPLTERLGADYRPSVIASAPALKVLDGQPVSDTEREGAAAVLLGLQARLDAAAAAAAAPSTFTIPGLSGIASQALASAQALLQASGNVEEEEEARREAQEVMERMHNHLPNQSSSTMPKGKGPSSKDGAAEAAEESDDNGISAARAMAAAALAGFAFEEADGAGSTAKSSKASSRTGSAKQRTTADLTSPMSAVLSTLPQLNAPPQITGPPKVKRSTKKSVVSIDDVPTAHLVVYEKKYSGITGHGTAVQIRGDGSLSIRFPDGTLALAVESTMDSGQVVYTMSGCYPGTGIGSVSLDQKGTGFVQYPDGTVALLINREEGTACVFNKHGDITTRLTPTSKQSIEIVLSRNLTFTMEMPGFRCSVLFTMDQIKQKVLHGRNEPPEGADDTAPLGQTGRGATSRVAATLSQSKSSPRTGKGKASGPLSPGPKMASLNAADAVAAAGENVADAIAQLHANLMAKMADLRKMDSLDEPAAESEAEVAGPGAAAGAAESDPAEGGDSGAAAGPDGGAGADAKAGTGRDSPETGQGPEALSGSASDS